MANFGKPNDSSFINNYFTSHADEYIKEYENNLKIIKENLVKIDALANLTKMGQLQSLVTGAYSKSKSYGLTEDIDAPQEIFSNLQDTFLAAGIISTTLAPEIKVVATTISSRFKLENFRLNFKNKTVLIPLIRKGNPSYASLNIPGSDGYGIHSSGGAGANGSW